MTQAQVQTGYVYPSAGVRILIPLVVSAFMEEASGVPMRDFSDYNIGVSVGSVPAAAFSFSDPKDPSKPLFRARDVLYTTFATAHAMFDRDPRSVMINNVWRDVPTLLGTLAKGWLGKHIMGQVESRRPSESASRYDPSVLEASLLKRFGDRPLSDAQKTFFIIAHGINARSPHLFGHVDHKQFPWTPDVDLHLNKMPLHDDESVVEAILSATAIPGIIGYRKSGRLSDHFMDAGQFSAPSFFALMEDMHDLAETRLKTEHNRSLSARSAFQKVASIGRAKEPPPTLVSRLVYMGVGDDTAFDFDINPAHGIVPQAQNIVRAAGDHVRHFSNTHIEKRFGRISEQHTGQPALRSIDANIVPQTDDERASFPAPDITDGRIQNLMRLMAFGRKVAIDNRDAICDEITLRAKTLEARGTYTPAQAAAVIERVSTYRDASAAAALCDKIVFAQDHAGEVLASEGVSVTQAAEPQAGNGGNGLGWIPAAISNRVASAVFSII